jgi:hypothetical protein
LAHGRRDWTHPVRVHDAHREFFVAAAAKRWAEDRGQESGDRGQESWGGTKRRAEGGGLRAEDGGGDGSRRGAESTEGDGEETLIRRGHKELGFSWLPLLSGGLKQECNETCQ